MKIFVWWLTFLFLTGPKAFAFQSESIQQLWEIPTNEVKAQTIKSYYQGGIKVEEVYYFSRPYLRSPVKIFGYFCYPPSFKKLPAILLSHGGGGTASLVRAVSWAKRGYAVLAIDLPGKGENRGTSRSTGPDMVVPNLLRTQPDLSYNYLIHAVAAARNGITYLSQRKEVDPERIGMIGLSWGGVITLLTNGQDKRLKAAVNVFGAGYIPEGCTWQDRFVLMPALDKDLWNNYLDPKNFLATQHAPILFVTGTNDHCYYLPTFQKSYEEIPSQKEFYLIPNLRHRFLNSAQTPALAWLDQKLKYGGSFPKISFSTPFLKELEKIILPVRVKVNSQVKKVSLYYASGGPQMWTHKSWKEIKPFFEPSDNMYYFAIPTKLISPEILFFISAEDNHGGASSTLVRSFFSVKLKDGTATYALSSPIKKTFRHEKPVRLLNNMVVESGYFAYSPKDRTYHLLEP